MKSSEKVLVFTIWSTVNGATLCFKSEICVASGKNSFLCIFCLYCAIARSLIWIVFGISNYLWFFFNYRCKLTSHCRTSGWQKRTWAHGKYSTSSQNVQNWFAVENIKKKTNFILNFVCIKTYKTCIFSFPPCFNRY